MTPRIVEPTGMRAPTLFVLGAGASIPYGLPSGLKLRRWVIDALLKDEPRSETLRHLDDIGFSREEINAFRLDLNDAHLPSIDAFLQIPAQRKHDRIARAAIASVLHLYEAAAYANVKEEKSWYRYFLTGLLGDDPALWGDLQLKVITLNFDRTFEGFVSWCLRRTFGFSDAESATEAQRIIPVCHLHGSLAGDYSWADNRRSIRREDVEASMTSIRIFSDAPDDRHLNLAIHWLKWAEVICFIGFGYHQFVEERLRLSELLLDKKEVHFTHFDVHPADLIGVRDRFKAVPRKNFVPEDVLTFLQNHRLTVRPCR